MTQPDSRPADRPSRLLLVDAHAYAYRSFFAIRNLTSPEGRPTNAIFGFVKAVLRLREELNPTHEAVIWDGGLAPERLRLLPEYKGDRPPMPAELESQLDEIVAWVEASGGVSCCRDGVEADDWIATWARRAERERLQVVIASSDKDFLQLVTPTVSLVNPGDKSLRLWSADDVRSKTGVGPEAVVDWLSLVGDSVDNIAGVPGVGAKTAAALLGTFGSWEAMTLRITEVKPERIRSALEAARSVVDRNRDLVRLRELANLPWDRESLRLRSPDARRLRELYTRWGFRSLAAQWAEREPTQSELAI